MTDENVGTDTGTQVIEPPAGAGVPTDTPPPAGPADPKELVAGDGPKPTIKLPASIKPPAKTGSGRFQARISDLVGQRDTAHQENVQLRERISRMEAVNKPAKGGAGKIDNAENQPAEGKNGLSPDDFETYEAYIQALVNQTVEQREEAGKSKAANDAYNQHKQERNAIFNEQAAPLAAEYGDGFWDAITDPALPVSEAMVDAIMELDELGPFTMLYLAAHKDEAAKMFRMNPRAATIAIGRLAAKLDYEINKDGNGTVLTDANKGSDAPHGALPTGATRAPALVAPKPTPVPTPRGSVATSLDGAPKDDDDVQTWLDKEVFRMRRNNPNAKIYGGR